jgi:PKD repeat protein
MRTPFGPFLLAVLLSCLGCGGTSPVAPADTILRLDANPTTISITGTSTITVTALHPSGVPARTGTEVFLTTTLGTIDATVKTDSNGIARATLRADGRAGTATVKANSGTAAAPMPVTVTIGTGMPQTLKASFTATISESLTVLFADTSTGNPTSWQWDFGDGGQSSERQPVHTYAKAAPYIVTLRVRNPDSQDTTSQRVTVPASETTPPVASFTFAVVGLQVTFTDTSMGTATSVVRSWQWDFGDGTQSTVQNPVHLYRQAGIYSVILAVGNGAGSSTSSKSVTVPTSPSSIPVASFAFQEVDNFTVLFRDTSSNNPTSWQWDFGDGTAKSQDQNPAHKYAGTGTYTVSLTAGNLAGRTTASQFVLVRGPLVADFDFSPQPTGHMVLFTDRSRGEPTSFTWDFGDNAKSMDQNPRHTYAAGGPYTVTLTVSRTVSGGSAMEQAVVTKVVMVQ